MTIFRDFKLEDTELLIKHLNNENVIRYLSTRIPYPYTNTDAAWWIETGSKDGITKAIEFEGEFAGVIGITRGEHQHSRQGEIGYWLGEKFWGKGIASKAVAQMTENILSTTDIVRLFAPVYNPNKASMHVLEKCNYKLDCVFEKKCF